MGWCSSDSLQHRERKARRDYRCQLCGGIIPKGSQYSAEYGGWREHLPGGCVQPATRENEARRNDTSESATMQQPTGQEKQL